MIAKPGILLLACAAVALLAAVGLSLGRNDAAEPARIAGIGDRGPVKPAAARAGSTLVESRHYAIESTATAEQTKVVADAVDGLNDAYRAFFRDAIPRSAVPAKLRLTLYRDQAEFKRHNQSSPWAEAYYRYPSCHAYYAEGDANPYHWMIHEATHQLNREVAHFQRAAWMDEGLATYFGASRMPGGVLMPGAIDANAYPIWWLRGLPLSGNLDADIASGKIIPLRSIVSGKGGPPIARHVNLYYIEYWSLSHFLFHYQDGRYAQAYRQVIASDGSLASFEKLIGPIDVIQAQWYAYLLQQVDSAGGQAGIGVATESVEVVE